jgi:hypothetical protein
MLVYAHPAQAPTPLTKLHAIWVFPDPEQPGQNPVLNSAAGQQLIANARASRVNMIYLSVYSSTPNSRGRYLYDETLIANFIAAARLSDIQVYAAYGAPDWPTLGCGTPGRPSFPIKRLQEIGAYNGTNPSALVYDPVTNTSYTSSGGFAGVILDVEPPAVDQKLLSLYACFQQTARQYYLGLSVAINAFWNNPIGSGAPAYQQILNMSFNNVVIMGYRTSAGTFGANDNGIISLDTAVVAYKNDYTTVLLGLETKNLGADDPRNTQSFSSSGQAALNYQAQSVYNQFWTHGYSFGGFAVHNYADSYLGGTTNWPSINPIFPTGVSIQSVAAGVASAVTIGTATVTITFPKISNSNAMISVTPLNPAAQRPMPVGFQSMNLAFDISTTAVFTGSAAVCFSLPSLTSATFANLRVLHSIGGSLIDQTSGLNANNPSTSTICASVTSFGSFVLAKSTLVATPAFRVQSPTGAEGRPRNRRGP